MYKNVCHKIIVYVLVGCLSFGVPATTYYKSVHAFEWAGGALAFEEALKWLLAIVGVTAAGSVASQVDWSDVRDQCVEVQLQQGATQSQVSEWWAKLARGTLDKASSCWSSFLEWSQSLTDTSSSVVIPSPGCTYSEAVEYINSLGILPNTIPTDNSYNNYNIYNFMIVASKDFSFYNLYFFYSDKVITFNSSSYRDDYLLYTYFPNTFNHNKWSLEYGNLSLNNDNRNYYISSNIVNNFNTTFNVISFGGSSSVTFDWQSAIDVAKQNLELLNRDLPDENSSEVAIPMPGLADSDNEASADAYDNIIDAINDGTITLDDGIAQIQDLLHVLVIDDTTDIVQPIRPDPDTGEPEKKDDVIKENKSNMGFTLAGLEKVFPFCIPFDIYAFITLLVAEPVAPEFDFPIKSVNNQTENIHIDLSPFEPVAVVVRYIFDFLFIIGLALMTRSLIGGGSSD